jgi:two-component system NtrC family sensor kinase
MRGDTAVELDHGTPGPRGYRSLRRRMTLVTIAVALVPLLLLLAINYYQDRQVMKLERVAPIRNLLDRTRHALDLFLAERRSAVSYIASAYPFEVLSDRAELVRIFEAMRREFGGFIDLGLIDAKGVQINYVGPYELVGKDHSEQDWFQEVFTEDVHISEVFLGHRRRPHFVIAVRHSMPSGESWILRATLDTEKINGLVFAQDAGAGRDTFLVNRSGVLQTPSRLFGEVLEQCRLDIGDVTPEPTVRVVRGPDGRPILLGLATFEDLPFIVVSVHPDRPIWVRWSTLTAELLLIFLLGLALIIGAAHRWATLAVRRIQASEQTRRQALREVAHASKLASVGRLAAGVAHEVNNPLAIIDQKAGLLKDLVELGPPSPQSAKFADLADSIMGAVDRSRAVTHRLLGFARRMDPEVSPVDLNELIEEVLGFLQTEARHREIRLELDLSPDLPEVESDRGQLQQVFLNILNNSLDAVSDEGRIRIRTRSVEGPGIMVSIEDDGVGMPAETLQQIFEPFFTTKSQGEGTGLGLSITYGIVKRLGGTIDARSAPGQGTTFTVTIPAKRPDLEEI